MEKQIYDDSKGLRYELHGDYYFRALRSQTKNKSQSESGDSDICGISRRTSGACITIF